MPKAPKKTMSKKKFDINELRKGLNISDQTSKNKARTWIPFSEAFHDATTLPGIPKGEVCLVRGFSDTGKSTMIYESIAGAQKIGDFVVIVDTEGSFNFEHARDVGMEYEEVYDEETGELIDYRGDNFLFISGGDLLDRYENFDYSDGKTKTKPLRNKPVIEDVAKFYDEILMLQKEGAIPFDILFLWDSIGSVGCFQSAKGGTSNNMWDAGALKRSFRDIMHFNIPESKRETSEYTNTFLGVNKIWLDSQGGGAPIVRQSGGDGFIYYARLIFHVGGKISAGSAKAKATSQGNEYIYASTTKIEVAKNHVNGVTTKGKISSTGHGYWNPDKLNDYKKQYKEFIADKLGAGITDFHIEYIDKDGDTISEDEMLNYGDD